MDNWAEPALDDQFAGVVANIQKRAETQLDFEKLAEIHIPTDLTRRATTHNSQLVLGRR